MLSGAWLWETDDAKFESYGNLKPQGYLTFSTSDTGELRGHSYAETPYAPGQKLKSQLDIVSFEGRTERLQGGEMQVAFTLTPGSGATVSSSAVLDEKDGTLRGSSKVDIVYNGEPAHITYTWVARKLR
jgi:hypothetical protein